MLTKKAFRVGMGMLSTCNLEIDETKLDVWYKICVNNFGDDLFLKCCEALCLEHPKFWPTDNPVGLINEKAKELRPLLASRAQITRNDRLLAPKKEKMVDPAEVREYLKNWTKSFENNCHT
ncbi:uncharacterized protein METZ01_LOCUS420187 [marine metagenome]|mgnify:FL=1|uniref:Uncharacterized protein n=1 Tax=marine metagenome TaxID=408172 RepID=A0A382X8Q6_9ZZZZ